MAGVSKGLDHLLVRVLGPLWVSRRGAEQPLADRAMRAVLSTLLVDANHPVPADALVDAAWEPTELPRSPLDSLDTRISRLRTLLAPEADITWAPGGCVLHIAADRIDAVCFERMVEAARWCPPREAISTLDRALGLWRGEALPDLRRHGREHPEAIRLRQLRARAVEDLAARELEVGNVEDAAGRLLALLSAEPLRERACGYAMWALHHLGMTDDAVTCYEQLAERLDDELGERPSVELTETYRAVTGRGPCPVRPSRSPTPRTSFTGRTHEVARLSTMLERERMVTITGPGGCGKTRLALEVLATTDHPATVVWMSTRESDEVPLAVAAALGVHTHDRDPDVTAAVAEYLSGRRHILLLDCCEHLLTAARTLTRRLRARCPDVTVLATSRVRLGLGGEQVLPLGPLARDGVRDPLTSRAGKLFLDRARRVRADFPADGAETDTARAVLRRIDCLPLTLELFAARVADPGWTAPSRWPPDVVEWSFERLSPAQRELLAALTVFGPGVDTGPGTGSTAANTAGIDAASCEAVIDAGAGTGADTGPDAAVGTGFDGGGGMESRLAGLARTGLLTTTHGADGARYRMPDLVYRVALRRFACSEAQRKTRERHASWCVDLIDDAAGSAAEGEDLYGYERLRRAEGDICAALRWAVTTEPTLAAELTGRIGLLSPYRPRASLVPWQLRVARDPDPRLSRHALAAASGAEAAVRCGLAEEALRLAARAAELATTVRQRCLALHTLISAYHELGEDDRTATVCHELIGIPEAPEVYLADAYGFLALVAARRGTVDDGLRAAEAAARHARAAGSTARAALAAYAEGELRLLSDLSHGAATLVTARTEAAAADATWITASASTALAGALVRLGRLPEAAKLLQQVLDDWQRMRDLPRLRAGVVLALDCLTAAGDRATAEALSRTETGPGQHGPGPAPHGRGPGEHGDSDETRTAGTARAAARALAAVFGTARP